MKTAKKTKTSRTTSLLKKLLITSALILSPAALSSNISLANQYLEAKQYQQAFEHYNVSAQQGNLQAIFQLGAMNYLGWGVDKNAEQALVWFSLAAQYDYKNAKQLVDKLKNSLTEQQLVVVESSVNHFQTKYGLIKAKNLYLPHFKTETNHHRIHFIDDEEPSKYHASLGHQTLDTFEFFDGENHTDGDTGMLDFEGEVITSQGDELSDSENFNRRPSVYFLVVDSEVSPDGSLRDFNAVETMGDSGDILASLPGNTSLRPVFNEQQTHFIHRSYLGIANLERNQMKEEHPYLYAKIKRMISPLKGSELPAEQYEYAMALISLSWIKREPGEIARLLKNAAESDHALAQYEYGLYLYREQKNPQQAMHWLTKASKKNVAKAQYRIGRFLLESPWLEYDEEKALYWLESAANNHHNIALRKAAQIKLLTENSQLKDISGAISYLKQLEGEQQNNPEYQYLQAIAHNSMTPRNRAKAVSYLKAAINQAESYQWDVSAWQAQLKKWTTGGRVTISEI